MPDALLIYHGIYGHTRKICEALREELAKLGHNAEIVSLAECEDSCLDASEAIVIGAAIRNGKHNSAVLEFIRTRRDLLESRPSGFFSINLVARKPEKNRPETNPYVKAFLARSPWRPKLVGVFAGNLDYRRYRFMDRHIIRFIMTLTGGPTDLDTRVEFTDWNRVREFAGEIAGLMPGHGES